MATATSTKERYEELKKNPLLFGKYRSVEVFDEITYSYATVKAWSSCDSTIDFTLRENNLPSDAPTRKLFVIGNLIQTSGKVEEKKDNNDIVRFEIVDFDVNKSSDWCRVFNDCQYNFKSGNYKHCHMALFWALYTTSWNQAVIKDAIAHVSAETLKTVSSYITQNILMLSVRKQQQIVELMKGINPSLKPLVMPDVEAMLKELSPAMDFSSYGFFDKVDYILNFGANDGEQEHLQSLYSKSTNGFTHFKYWLQHIGHKFYNYDFLETVFSYSPPSMQLNIVKRYLHDVRLNIIDVDYSMLERLRDINGWRQLFVNVRYFITNPGDDLDMVAPMLCDSLLTLKRNDGMKIQDFNGILDFAISHSNRAYPNINLGINRILPVCDGGLMHNPSFYGFIHYSILYSFDETKLTEERLKRTVDYMLDKYASLVYGDFCTNDKGRRLNENETAICRKLFKERREINFKGEKKVTIVETPCSSLSHKPIQPLTWKRKDAVSDKFLSSFIDHIESKQFITYEDVRIEKLKANLIAWGRKYNSYNFYNGNEPEYLVKNNLYSHFVHNYFSEKSMSIYPNDCMFYSWEKSLLKVWDAEGLNDEKQIKELAQRTEAPIVYKNTFDSLKKMYPHAKIGADCIELPYNQTELNKITAYFHYSPHQYDLNNRYSRASERQKVFLISKKKHGVLYCTPKVAGLREQVSGLPFFWCRSDECFFNMLNRQTLDKQNDWREYTLYHAAEIIGYKLIEETDEGNIPIEAVANFASEVRQAERLYSRLICRSCGHMIFSTRGTILNGSRFFSCANCTCPEYKAEVYLSQCNTCKKGLIDSRDSKKCENGWVICPSCLSCCNDALFDKLIDNHRRNGRVPQKLLDSKGKGHNNKGLFFCPKCGSQIGKFVVEEKRKKEDGTEVVVNNVVIGCPQCRISYEKELEKNRDSHIDN